MSDPKSHQFRPPLYHGQRGESGTDTASSGAHQDRSAQARNEQKGWEAYRKWLSSMNGRASPARAPVDHSIYSWKGYHNWADRVRQSWKPEDN